MSPDVISTASLLCLLPLPLVYHFSPVEKHNHRCRQTSGVAKLKLPPRIKLKLTFIPAWAFALENLVVTDLLIASSLIERNEWFVVVKYAIPRFCLTLAAWNDIRCDQITAESPTNVSAVDDAYYYQREGGRAWGVHFSFSDFYQNVSLRIKKRTSFEEICQLALMFRLYDSFLHLLLETRKHALVV